MYETETKGKEKPAFKRQGTLERAPLFESPVFLQGKDHNHFNFNCDKCDTNIWTEEFPIKKFLKIFRICHFETRQWILVEPSRLSAWIYFSVFSPYSASLHVTHYNRSPTTTSCFPSTGPYMVWTVTICGNNAVRSWIVTHLSLCILLLLFFFMSLLHSILKAKWTSPLT